ncbi:hypothetical protein SD436_09555 [Streptococcus sp. 2A/TPW/M5]
MKHGNEIQKECQKKKKWKSIINFKNLLIMTGIIIMAIICIPILHHNHVNGVDAYKILKDKRFVFVQNQYDLMQDGNQGAGFDLQKRTYLCLIAL